MRSIITRVVAAVLIVITAFSAALAYNAVSQRRLVADLTRINQGYVPIARLLDDLSEELRSFARVLSSRDPQTLRQSIRASQALFPIQDRADAQLEALHDHLDALLERELPAREHAFVTNLMGATELLSVEAREVGVLVDALLFALDETPPRLEPAYGNLSARVIAFERRVDSFANVVANRTDSAVERMDAAEREILMRVVAASVVATLFALVMVVVIGRSLAPIRTLTAMAARFKEGDYRAEAVNAGRDEIGLLATEFTGMAEAIQARDALLRQQRDALEEAYEKLIEAQRAQVQAERLAAVGELAARVTHELRNPLSSISMNAEMLSEELEAAGADFAEAHDMLHAIEREIARLTDLTERYLSLARSEEPRRASVDVAQLVRDVVAQRAAEHDRRHVEVRVDAPETLIATVDEPQVRQLLINLLRNALDALDARDEDGAPREIAVRLADEGDTFTLAVEDSGPGVPDDLADSIFEPFVTTRTSGTGLGLAISRQIARRHGGDLTVAPAALTRGAAFVMRCPTSRRNPSA